MKIKAYQAGGGFVYAPYLNQKAGVTDQAKADDTDAKLDPLDKEILGLMKDKNLLPSDIQVISNALIAYQRSTQHLGNSRLGSSNYRMVMPGMLKILNMVETAKFNRAQ